MDMCGMAASISLPAAAVALASALRWPGWHWMLHATSSAEKEPTEDSKS